MKMILEGPVIDGAEPQEALQRQPDLQLQPDEALLFLELLGKDPTTARFRFFPHKDNPRKNAIGARKEVGFRAERFKRHQAAGRNAYIVIGKGGDDKKSIIEIPALFIEWDDQPLEWQRSACERFGLPEPSLQNETGNKSLHNYWFLAEPAAPDQWIAAQDRLSSYLGSDPSINDLSRVMRLPGFAYIGAEGMPTGQCRIVSASGKRYSLDQILVNVPELSAEPAKPPKPAGAMRVGARSMNEVRAALKCIPPREAGTNTYPDYRKALWGLIRAVEEAGGTRDQAIEMMQDHSPDGWDVEQVGGYSFEQVTSGSFWFLAQKHGYQLSANISGSGRLMRLEQAKAILRERCGDGISGTDLAQLVGELADATDRPSSELQRIAEGIAIEQEVQAQINAEAQALAAEVDRQEISSALTASYLLPATIAHALEVRTRYLPTDGPAAVIPYLAAVAGLLKLGTQVEASAVAGYRVPINLYAALVARSGAKKSPVGRLLVDAPTHELMLELARQHNRDRQRWQEDCRGLKKDDRPPEPQQKRLRISDPNGEGLAQQLQIQESAGLGLLIYRDELSGWFNAMNQFRGGRGSDEQQYLETYDGGGLTSVRVSGDRNYGSSQLSIYGTIQPAVLRELVAHGDASGLWARFLFAPLPAKVVPLQQHITDAEVAEVEAAAALLADTCRKIYELPPKVYKLSPDAALAFTHYEANRQREALDATISAQSALYGKSAGKVLRVAGLLHLLRIAAGEASRSDLIDASSIERATALVDNLDAWALSFHAEVAAGAQAPMLRTIHQLALAAKSPLRWKDIRDRLSKKQRKGWDAASAHAAMEALAAAGYGMVEGGQRGCHAYLAQRPMH